MIIGKQDFCDFQTIQSAVEYLEKLPKTDSWTTMYILDGVYEERVTMTLSKIRLIGIGHVVIKYNAYARQKDSSGMEIGTFETATVHLEGTDIHLENLTLENTAGQGEVVGQALALYANCDTSTFKNCQLKAHQDTLFCPHLPSARKDGSAFQGKRIAYEQYRQVFSQCEIEGTVDFIFGGATAYFDRCVIKSKNRDSGKESYITAASTPEKQAFGFVFNECFLIAEAGSSQVYLGRPWRPHAHVRFQQCYMSGHIHIDRWHDWGKPENRETARFEEYGTIQNQTKIKKKDSWYTASESVDHVLKLSDLFDHTFYKRVEEKGI
ncbi:pectinesterase family protein [Marinilactibacillus sp. XAAS-LB27]|uniref:pectinesterase family protein n=1 Tax=Marinilactibacillus sp. XAAS-LB27 TaxID=3114538 RepID=UPI002E171664|nr:pectinesterase family protein [Marinilactibacillus sp. XAAS-LB27]